jgi:hypothetical protein
MSQASASLQLRMSLFIVKDYFRLGGYDGIRCLKLKLVFRSERPLGSQGGSRKALSGLPLAHFWERGTEGVRAEMCIHGSPRGEGFRMRVTQL